MYEHLLALLVENCSNSFLLFQFRFRGMKGVVAVNPLLDEYAAWAKKYNIPRPRKQNGSWDLKLVFRPSQKK